MKEEKILGKIDYAEFGMFSDRSFMMGLILGFSLKGGSSHISTTNYTVNISKACRWESGNRSEAIEKIVDDVHDILVAAKVDTVSELIGKPVMVTIDENNTFKDFRILTEVL